MKSENLSFSATVKVVKDETKTGNIKTIRNLWMQYLTGVLVTLISFNGGTMSGWFSSTLPKLRDGEGPFPLTNSQTSWVLSISSIGTLLSAYFVSLAMHRWSRKSLIVLYFPFILLSFTILYFAKNVIYLYTTKFIYGVIEPIKYPILSFYLGEIADKTVRGRLSSLNTISFKVGEMISLALSPYLEYKSYTAVLMIFPILSFVCAFFIPKSPYFKLMKGDRNGAWKNYRLLNRNFDEICLNQELDVIDKKIQEEMQNESSFPEFFKNSTIRKALLMFLGLKTIRYCSGVGAIHQYLQIILGESHSDISTNLSAIICSGLQALGVFISYFLIDRIGRKPLLYISFTGSALSLFICGLYFFLSKFYSDSVANFTWIPTVAIIFYEFIEIIGSPISFVQISEIFTINMKDKILVLNAVYVGIISFTINKMFGVISDEVGMYLTFWICCLCLIMGIFFTLFIVMETKGKTLAEIQEQLSIENEE